MIPNALVLSGGLLHTSDAKTAHGLIRESNRFKIVGFVDAVHAGKDAGEVLDGQKRGLPVFTNVEDAIHTKPEYCIVGVATNGGIFPVSMLDDVKISIRNGLSIVNGLHDYLTDRPEMLELAKQHKVELIDIRKPKNRAELHFAKHADIDLFWGCNDESLISITAALHAALSCVYTKFLDLDGSFDLTEDLAEGGFILEDGYLMTNNRSGLGVGKSLIS